MTNEEKMIRAQQAKDLLAHPLLIAAFDEVRAGFLRELEQIDLGDGEALVQAHAGLKLAGRLQQVLRGWVNMGTAIAADAEYFARQDAEERSIDEELNRRMRVGRS
jgi:hypothetical protein